MTAILPYGDFVAQEISSDTFVLAMDEGGRGLYEGENMLPHRTRQGAKGEYEALFITG